MSNHSARTDSRLGLRDSARGEFLTAQLLTVVASRVTAGRSRGELVGQFLARLFTAAETNDAERRAAILQDIRGHGVSVEDIVDILIPEAARMLGEDWLDDSRSFAEVTMVSARLQLMLRDLATEWRADHVPQAGLMRMMLALPGSEQHTLGALVAASQFRRLGVSVRVVLGQSDDQVVGAAQSDEYDLIALSVSSIEKIDAVRRIVKVLRAESRNLPPIVLGGPLAAARSDLKILTGVDFVTCKPEEAMRFCAAGAHRSHPGVEKVQV